MRRSATSGSGTTEALDSDIAGATDATYVLTSEDQGKTILVRVSFTDDGGNAETRTSPPTTEVEAALTAEFQSVPDNYEGPTPFIFRVLFSEPVEASHQALREHSFEVSNGTIVEARRVDRRNDLWEIEVQPRTHADVVVTLPPTVDCAYAGAVCTNNGKRLSSRLQITVAPPANSPPLGSPTISGTVEPGDTLTSNTSGISDDNGLTGAIFTYQWVSYDGHAETDIQGATGSTYTLVPADEGRAFRVRVSFTDAAGNSHSLTSALVYSERPYGLNASESDGAVELIWNPPVGWTGSTFQVLRNRPELDESEPLVHVRFVQTGTNTYTDTDVEPGVLYMYQVKGVDPFGYPGEASRPVEIRTMEATLVENSPATGTPTIIGTAQVGETLTVDTSGISDPDGLANATFAYQWMRVETDSAEADITGATTFNYPLVAADQGKAISGRVSFTDDAGNAETLTSEVTEAVAGATNSPAIGVPAIIGTAQVGETLTADTSSISDVDGLTRATFTYQWLADGTEIQGATGSTYAPETDDVGKAITVQVSFTDDAGNAETLTSEATETMILLIWSGTLTAASSGTMSGYSLPQGTGTLLPSEFSVGVADFTVRMVLEGDDGVLTLGLDRQLSTPFTLHVGPVAFAQQDAEPSPSEDGTGYTYRWDLAALDWSAGEDLSLRMTTPERPLTAVFETVPESHDGSADFTFELRFSEESPLSYRTLRDHAFTVTGGSIKKAERMNRPSNIHWRITVSPDSDGSVTIVLPVTEDCADEGAVCTEDGRMLANPVEFTVAGPDG